MESSSFYPIIRTLDTEISNNNKSKGIWRGLSIFGGLALCNFSFKQIKNSNYAYLPLAFLGAMLFYDGIKTNSYGNYETYHQFKEMHHEFKNTEKPISLSLFATDDPTLAFEYPDTTLLDLEKNGYEVIVRKVSSIKDINREINSIGKKIDLLFIHAHGLNFSIDLSAGNIIEEKNIHLIQVTNLSPRAIIILDSCSVGKSDSSEEPVAKSMARILKKTILAPTKTILNYNFYIEKNITDSKWKILNPEIVDFEIEPSITAQATHAISKLAAMSVGLAKFSLVEDIMACYSS